MSQHATILEDLDAIDKRLDELIADNRQLRAALKGLLAVSWPKDDKTANAIRTAEKALKQ